MTTSSEPYDIAAGQSPRRREGDHLRRIVVRIHASYLLLITLTSVIVGGIGWQGSGPFVLHSIFIGLETFALLLEGGLVTTPVKLRASGPSDTGYPPLLGTVIDSPLHPRILCRVAVHVWATSVDGSGP
ncbi:MAG TPA: hypothetical protein VIL34_22510 [Actinopolymorphaceae bacterium]|jgi:hypothetical protein